MSTDRRRERYRPFHPDESDRPAAPPSPPPILSPSFPSGSTSSGSEGGAGYADHAALCSWANSVTKDLKGLREAVAISSTAIRYYAENGVTAGQLDSGLGTKANEGETRNRLDTLRKEVRRGFAERRDDEELEEALRKKVDWEKFHDTVATYTEKTVGDWVHAHVGEIRAEIESHIKSVFDVDPTLRADMQEVRRLAGKVSAAEVSCTKLRSVVERGLQDTLDEAATRLGGMVDSSLSSFVAKADTVHADVVGRVNTTAGTLEERVTARLEAFDSEARMMMAELKGVIDQRVSAIETRLQDKFNVEFAKIENRTRKAEMDASIAKKQAAEVATAFQDLSTTVNDVIRRMEDAIARVRNIEEEFRDIKKTVEVIRVEQLHMKPQVADNTRVIKKLSAASQKMKTQLEILEKEHYRTKMDLESSLADLQRSTSTDITQLRKQATQLTNSLRMSEQGLKRTITTMNKQLSADITTLTSSLDRQTRELEDRVSRVQQRGDDRLIAVKAPLKTLQKAVADIDRHHNSQHWDLRATVGDNGTEIRRLWNRLGAPVDADDTTATRLESLAKAGESHRAELSAMKRQMKEIKGEEQEARLRSLVAEEASSQVDGLKKELEGLQSRVRHSLVSHSAVAVAAAAEVAARQAAQEAVEARAAALSEAWNGVEVGAKGAPPPITSESVEDAIDRALGRALGPILSRMDSLSTRLSAQDSRMAALSNEALLLQPSVTATPLPPPPPLPPQATSLPFTPQPGTPATPPSPVEAVSTTPSISAPEPAPDAAADDQSPLTAPSSASSPSPVPHGPSGAPPLPPPAPITPSPVFVSRQAQALLAQRRSTSASPSSPAPAGPLTQPSDSSASPTLPPRTPIKTGGAESAGMDESVPEPNSPSVGLRVTVSPPRDSLFTPSDPPSQRSPLPRVASSPSHRRVTVTASASPSGRRPVSSPKSNPTITSPKAHAEGSASPKAARPTSRGHSGVVIRSRSRGRARVSPASSSASKPLSPFDVEAPLGQSPVRQDLESPSIPKPSEDVGGVSASVLARTLGVLLHAVDKANSRSPIRRASPVLTTSPSRTDPSRSFPTSRSPAAARMANLAHRQDAVTERLRRGRGAGRR